MEWLIPRAIKFSINIREIREHLPTRSSKRCKILWNLLIFFYFFFNTILVYKFTFEFETDEYQIVEDGKSYFLFMRKKD